MFAGEGTVVEARTSVEAEVVNEFRDSAGEDLVSRRRIISRVFKT